MRRHHDAQAPSMMSAREEKLGIVIEGGGLRGAFAVGALDELDRVLPVRPAHVFATSSGAPNAAYFATGQIADGVRIWEEHTHGSQLLDFGNLLRPAPVMKIDELVAVFRSKIQLDAARLTVDGPGVHIAVTEVESGANHVLRATPDNVFALLTAAMAIPVAYGKVVPVEQGLYIDGGFGAPVAIREALALGLDRIIVVLTKPRGHRRKRSALAQWLQCSSYDEYPHAQAAIRAKWHNYNATMDLIDEHEQAGKLVVVRPPAELPVSRLSRSRARIVASIELGRAAVRSRSNEILAYADRA
jgi:predicted patatin/cPLA2 family phospholipase